MLAARVADLAGWRRMAAAFSAGTVSVLAMPPFFLSPVLFLTLPILVWLIDGADGRSGQLRSRRGAATRAAISGWWFGFGYFLFGLYWIGEAFLVEADKFAWALPFAVTLLPAGLSLFFALAAFLARFAWCDGIARIVVLSVTLALTEWLRGHVLTGFPWNTLGYALTSPLPLMQTAGVLGIYGLTLWTVLIFASPLVLWVERGQGWRAAALPMMVAMVPLAVLAAGGWLVLSRDSTVVDDRVLIRIVQPSIPQREKWLPEMQARNFAIHLDTSREDATGKRDDLAGVTHVIWPEAAMPFLPLDRPEALAMIGELLPSQTYLVTGALRLKRPAVGAPGPVVAYNSLMAFGTGGRLASLYDKIHLVPFGEYLPFQDTLERWGFEQLTRLRGGFAVGETPRPLLSLPGLPRIGGLICYEAIFPGEVVQGQERPGLLINLTNDGWFGNSIGPHQHFHQARVRAVEQGLPLIRAANNGISAVIDSQGRILSRLELNRRGVIDTGLPSIGAPTLYSRFGDTIFALNILAFSLWALMLRRSPRSPSARNSRENVS